MGGGAEAVINRQSSARAKWTFRPFPLGQGEWQVGGGRCREREGDALWGRTLGEIYVIYMGT